jgi:hypothetical protein
MVNSSLTTAAGSAFCPIISVIIIDHESKESSTIDNSQLTIDNSQLTTLPLTFVI